MKRLLLSVLGVAVASAAQSADLTLKDGSVLKNARIVAISGSTVTVVHNAGSKGVPLDNLDPEVVARAKIELEDREAARKVRTEEATRKAVAQKAETDQAREEKLAVARAMSAVREQNQKGESLTALSAPVRPTAVQQNNRAQQVAALKATFPAKSAGNARVFIPRSGRNERPYIVWNSVGQLPGGGTYTNTTTRHNEGAGRVDTIQYDAPPIDVWSWYRGMFQTTNAEAFPRTLSMVEARFAEDTGKFQTAASSLSPSAAAQAQHTLYWFDKSLRPYIERWRSLSK